MPSTCTETAAPRRIVWTCALYVSVLRTKTYIMWKMQQVESDHTIKWGDIGQVPFSYQQRPPRQLIKLYSWLNWLSSFSNWLSSESSIILLIASTLRHCMVNIPALYDRWMHICGAVIFQWAVRISLRNHHLISFFNMLLTLYYIVFIFIHTWQDDAMPVEAYQQIKTKKVFLFSFAVYVIHISCLRYYHCMFDLKKKKMLALQSWKCSNSILDSFKSVPQACNQNKFSA